MIYYTAGMSGTFSLRAGASISITSSQVSGTVAVTGNGVSQSASIGAAPYNRTFGPFNVDTSVAVSALVGGGRMGIDVVGNTPDIVVSSSAPVDADGRPDGTIWVQTA